MTRCGRARGHTSAAANARSDFNIGFSGYRFNGDIGAYTVRFRHYDPTPGMCRWLERDPAGYQDGPSLYSYLGRNPMAGTDPYGLLLSDWWRDMGDGFEALRDYWRSPSSPSDWWRDTTEGWGALPLYLDSPLERFGLGVLKGAVTTLALTALVIAIPVTAPVVIWGGVGMAFWTAYELVKNPDRWSEGDRWELIGQLVGGFGTARGVTSPGAVSQFGGRSFRMLPRGPKPSAGNVTVARWEQVIPQQARLHQGQWVMRGGANLLNWLFSGTGGGGQHFRPFANAQSHSVARGSLRPPNESVGFKPWDVISNLMKYHLLRQAQYIGESTAPSGGSAGAATGW